MPRRDDDLILRLYFHYFAPAELMKKQRAKLELERQRKGKLSLSKVVDENLYFRLWLALLYVVCEQFSVVAAELRLRPEKFEEELLLRARIIETNFEEHKDSLRVFRNGQFHFQESPEKLAQFFRSGAKKITWADRLHNLISDFLSDYRVLCEVCYALEGRKDQSTVRRTRG